MSYEQIRLNMLALASSENFDVGCQSNELKERLLFAYDNFSDKGICLVGSWTWVNVELTEDEKADFFRNFKPAFLFSDNVMADTPERGLEWVRTSLLVQYFHPGIFVTRNTCYVMSGVGKLSSISLQEYYDLCFIHK